MTAWDALFQERFNELFNLVIDINVSGHTVKLNRFSQLLI